MLINLLKRAESSIHAFRLTSQRLFDLIDSALDDIDKHIQGRDIDKVGYEILEDLQSEDEEISFGKDIKIDINDMDYLSWQERLQADKDILSALLETIKVITPEHDTKLQEIKALIKHKTENPINVENKKLLIFTAFADTAKYLYDALVEMRHDSSALLHFAIITGQDNPRTTLKLDRADFNKIRQTGEAFIDHLNPKMLLDKLRFACKGKDEIFKPLVRDFNTQTNNGKNMSLYSHLLNAAIASVISAKQERDIDSLFSNGETTTLTNEIKGLNDFELIDFLVISPQISRTNTDY
jgi:hypothetical protein